MSDIEKEQPINILNKGIEPRTQYSGHPNTRRQYSKEDRLINHIYQLTHIEKEKVKVLFREAYIKGFRMDQIPEFIFIKSKLNVTYPFCVSLKKMQYEDDRNWFFELARDSTAYLSCYRLAIDKLSQLEKEMWLIIMNPKIEPSVRVMATKEIHAIIKTSVLLLRELPFITNLSKFYNLSELDPDKKGLAKLKYTKSVSNINNNDPLQREFSKDVFDNVNASLVHNILDNIKDHPRISPEVDTDVINTMQDQITKLGYDTDPEVKEKKEQERKRIDDEYIKRNLAQLDKELSQVTTEDEAKVVKAAQNYRKTLNYLDQIIPQEHRDAITKLRETTESE